MKNNYKKLKSAQFSLVKYICLLAEEYSHMKEGLQERTVNNITIEIGLPVIPRKTGYYDHPFKIILLHGSIQYLTQCSTFCMWFGSETSDRYFRTLLLLSTTIHHTHL